MALFQNKKRDKTKNHHHASSQHAAKKIADNRSLYNKKEEIGPPLPVNHWVDKHMMLCVNPRYDEYIHTPYDAQIAIPMNTVFPFESKLFKGKAIVRCVNLPSTNKAYFKGRARKMDLTLQGRFKRRLCFDRLYTGQIFDKPFMNLPGQMLISGAVKIVKSLAPAVMANIDSSTPHMMSPLASAAQVIEVSKPGTERPLPQEPKECLDLVDSCFIGMKFTDRKSYFNDLEHLSHYHFDPQFVYTISCYTHMVAPSSYSVHMMGMKWGLHSYIPSPFQAMQVVLPPKRRHKSKDSHSQSVKAPQPQDEEDSTHSSSNSNDTDKLTEIDDTKRDHDQEMEIMASEGMECESKEEEEAEHSRSKSSNSGKQRDGVHSEFDDLNQCEFLLNLQIWHTKLVDELYPALNPKRKKSGHRKSSGGMKGLFGL